MRTIDRKWFALKAERRALVDLFLRFIAAQAELGDEPEEVEKAENGDNPPGINWERKTLYGEVVGVQNVQTVAGQQTF